MIPPCNHQGLSGLPLTFNDTELDTLDRFDLKTYMYIHILYNYITRFKFWLSLYPLWILTCTPLGVRRVFFKVFITNMLCFISNNINLITKPSPSLILSYFLNFKQLLKISQKYPNI